jgi:hypothetical protein
MSDFPPYPGTLTKGIVHKKVEQRVNGSQQALEELLDALKDPSQNYVDILQSFAGVTPQEAAHLSQTWYGPQCWWPALHPMEPLVRQSLIKALEVARDRRLPINSYWLCAGNQFRVIVIYDNLQVFRLILTPAPQPGASETPVPQGAPSQGVNPARVWIFENPTSA